MLALLFVRGLTFKPEPGAGSKRQKVEIIKQIYIMLCQFFLLTYHA